MRAVAERYTCDILKKLYDSEPEYSYKKESLR